MRRLIFPIALLITLFFAPGTSQAADLTDGALGIPWGASQVQARQIMEQNGYTYYTETVDANDRSPMIFYKGMYASYRAQVGIKFARNQMFEVKVELWEADNFAPPDGPFRVLNRLLTEKYGPWTRDTSRSMPVQCSPRLNI